MPTFSRILDATVSWAKLDPTELRYVPCNICGTFDYETIGSMVISRTEFFLCRCKGCGMMWRTPLPGQSFSHELYSELYFSVNQHSPTLVDHVGIRDSGSETRGFRDRISQQVVQTWIDRGIQPWHRKDGSPRRLLEIGGGRGYLQQAAAKRGWDTTGLEISPHGIKEAIDRKSVVLPVTIDELCNRYIPYEKYFDVVVFYDFLEHVEDPGRVLRMIRTLLSEDGVIIFRVPNTIGMPSAHLIDHIWHFSDATLPILLDKESFEATDAHLSGVFHPQMGGSIDNITVYARKCEKPREVRAPLRVAPNPLGEVPPVPN